MKKPYFDRWGHVRTHFKQDNIRAKNQKRTPPTKPTEGDIRKWNQKLASGAEKNGGLAIKAP